ncbi:hypothetical protein NBRC110019_13300 [Neptunitalea chrysea]|uniref:Oxidoreductase n=1 Tax=Neptunitalea chrysea TaxID=1647581 RepID=A0A9W6B409_9FLAO|nr:oxidoreductase [Neptunitalea chrysea]GLB52291.1 hypothetical protein NBRC110019_13300 [Neptunitalea chrysea]
MKNLLCIAVIFTVLAGCNKKESPVHKFKEVVITPIFTDTVSIRTLEIMNNGNNVAFAGDRGMYGLYDIKKDTWRTKQITYDSITPEFRAIAHTINDFFMITVANPALLYKTGNPGEMNVVYKEENEKVFYDSMKFWNNEEGIAVGDATDGCASIIITRDGGSNWTKVTCDKLPELKDGEAFFAASNTNIVVLGDETWIASGGSRCAILYSPDKGVSWQLFNTPFITGESAGIFSIDFYDRFNGFAVGGDFLKIEDDVNNKAITSDGGKTWTIVADNGGVGYKSCVQYVPNRNANEIVALGRTGISYTHDAGKTWKKLSDESFYTFRFLNDSVAYAAGNNKVAKLEFK